MKGRVLTNHKGFPGWHRPCVGLQTQIPAGDSMLACKRKSVGANSFAKGPVRSIYLCRQECRLPE